MTILTKEQALRVVRRAYGAERAEELKDRLPNRIDLESAADTELLHRLGLGRDQLFDLLGGEL